MNNNKNKSNDFARLASDIKKAFSSVKSELDDHLESINQNTSEIQAGQGLLSEVEVKVDKLSERLDALELELHPDSFKRMDVRLSRREQEVFMTLYMARSLSVRDISRLLGFTEDMVNMYVLNIISKGVPVSRELVNDILVFSLEPGFKDLQARRGVLEIDPVVAKQVSELKI